jgi:hypothetical protein
MINKYNFLVGYTLSDIKYDWEEVAVPIADEAKEHLHNNGWEIVGTEKTKAVFPYDLPTGKTKKRQHTLLDKKGQLYK